MGTTNINQPVNQDVVEIFQEDYQVPVVMVKQDGPVTTHELPTMHGAAFTEVLSDTNYRKILSGPDEKRKRVVITTDGDLFISFTGATGSGLRLHGAAAVQGQIEITYVGSIWVAAVTGTVNVGVLVEYWAD